MTEMVMLLPVRFYGYDSLIYLACALIGFLISYKAYKLHSITEDKRHFYLYSAFTLLSVGFLIISITSAYSYSKFFLQGQEIVFNPNFDLADMGYWIYFFSSLISYILFALMYLPEEHKSKFLLVLPISLNYYSYFNTVLLFLIAFTALRSAMNYFSKRSFNSFLVMACFISICAYHTILLFTPFHKIFYIMAHVFLIVGFLSLLTMLLKVGK